jgi:8-oxo-dGTP pyrophosphatase MutT (NUDIX family)
VRRSEALARLRGGLRRPRERLDIEGFRRAGVLVPLLDAPGGLELLFTVRAATLPHHAGQIAFPGGGLEPGEGVVEGALREAHEEVGLVVGAGEVLGCLNDLPSPARYVATPVVAILPWPQPLALSAAEVDEAFTAPLAELSALTPSSEERELRGLRRTIYSYGWQGRNIWGFTGNVLRNLLETLD